MGRNPGLFPVEYLGTPGDLVQETNRSLGQGDPRVRDRRLSGGERRGTE